MNTERARRSSASDRHIKRVLLGSVCVLALGLAMATGSSPAAARYLFKHKLVRKQAEHAKLPFGEIPSGPLEVFISIEQQKLHLYSDGVHVADAPVATGVPGHLTPLGVFSVIERDRYHHSNIYSGAPMPYMERITWSGVAMHEGPGVGHQASHGCIRMPQDFAARLWMLPTMGMRVIIARPELRPLDFADPHLFVHKEPPSPAAALVPAVQTAQTVDPGTKTDVIDAAPPPQTAAPTADAAAPAKLAPTPDATPQKVAEPTLSEIAKTAASDATEPAKTTAPASTEPAKAVTAENAQTPAAPAAVSVAQPSAPSAPKEPEHAVPSAAASAMPAPADITAPIIVEDVPLPLSKPARIASGGSGPIAIFVSRKEGRIYVRQNFMPLFDAPVKIDDPKQPIGTHVFTAMDYMPDHSAFRWTVVTLPDAPQKTVEHWKYVTDIYGRHRRVRVDEHVAEPPPTPVETPQEALARIAIPQDVIDQISQLIIPGSSLIVSDQGLGEETGSYTDFIVVTR